MVDHSTRPDPDAAISLSAATRLAELSHDGRRPHVATLWRWAGMGGSGVRGVILRTWLVGGRRCTSVRAVREFLRAISGENAVPIVTPAQRRREINAAEDRLAGAGI